MRLRGPARRVVSARRAKTSGLNKSFDHETPVGIRTLLPSPPPSLSLFSCFVFRGPQKRTPWSRDDCKSTTLRRSYGETSEQTDVDDIRRRLNFRNVRPYGFTPLSVLLAKTRCREKARGSSVGRAGSRRGFRRSRILTIDGHLVEKRGDLHESRSRRASGSRRESASRATWRSRIEIRRCQ